VGNNQRKIRLPTQTFYAGDDASCFGETLRDRVDDLLKMRPDAMMRENSLTISQIKSSFFVETAETGMIDSF
jgi:hypothetical protein